MSQANFSLRGRNPDVLTCIANLSNDEVFTPPELANRMLDTLTEAWAANHDGANIWADKTVRFLDPCTKSGVFLREITSRLVDGLAEEIPDLEERVDHILTHQVFGIAITQITSLLARRSVYCSKRANGKHSIARSFATEDGNIWFERTEHTWTATNCKYCGAPKTILDRGDDLETYAYAFIHTDDIQTRIAELFGGNMQFDVIIGNPPYQIDDVGGHRPVPIYQKFVKQAMNLEPRFLIMVTPSRWMAGGLGLSNYRKEMLADKHVRKLVDYAKMNEVFPGVDFEGGVSYFLWDRDYTGKCEHTYYSGGEYPISAVRDLNEFDVLVRDERSAIILRKVLAFGEDSITSVMGGHNEFGLLTNFRDYVKHPTSSSDITVHALENSRRVARWLPIGTLPKGHDYVNQWKVLIPTSYGERGAIPAMILGPLLVASPPSCSTQTYLFITALSQSEAEIVASYARTRFFRFLLSLRKITQHASKSVYSYVPIQNFSHKWTDEMLYEKYGITPDEIAFIESMIRPMGDDDE